MTTDVKLGETLNLGGRVGAGAFGHVYQCQDEYGNEVAVKKIPFTEEGIPCLMEASLMATLHHPYINATRKTHTDTKHLYLIQDLAAMDLSRYIAKHGPPRLEKLRWWSWCLIKAVQCLHYYGYIHADIKAANVLYFSDDVIKLSDFTLLVRTQWGAARTKPVQYKHTVCTATHRPLEVWLGSKWDAKVDIWALACTLYEMAYGESLFPYQIQGSDTPSPSVIRDRSIDALADWGRRDPTGPQPNLPMDRKSKFVPVALHPRFENEEMVMFNDLILAMFRLDPAERPSADELLQHPFFQPLAHKKLVVSALIQPEKALPVEFAHRLRQLLTDFRLTPDVVVVTQSLVARCYDLFATLQDTTERQYILACAWIASKLVHRNAFDVGYPTSDMIAIERVICDHLAFRLI